MGVSEVVLLLILQADALASGLIADEVVWNHAFFGNNPGFAVPFLEALVSAIVAELADGRCIALLEGGWILRSLIFQEALVEVLGF